MGLWRRPGVGAEFDFDGDVGPELPVRDGVSFLLQLDIGMKEESWAECFPFSSSPGQKAPPKRGHALHGSTALQFRSP